MADGGNIPEWTGKDPAALDWNSAVLGDAIIPGVVSVEDLEVGIDVDTKKGRGHDKPTSTDNGLRLSKWKLRVWLNARLWPDFQIAAQSFQPRRPGRERQPLQIIRPEVNWLGITECRVSGIRLPRTPTARAGFVVYIHCEEWFDKPVATKKKEKAAIPANGTPVNSADALDRARVHALNLNRRQALRDMSENDEDQATQISAKPSDGVMSKIFGGLGGANTAGGS